MDNKDWYLPSGQRWFGPEATQAGMLIGGIGTGNFTVGNRGELRDWEIFNSPGKGNHMCLTFFAIRTQAEGEPPVAMALEGEIPPPYTESNGIGETGGLPRFREVRMKGEYPFVTVELKDDRIPVEAALEAFNPFLPLNADDSGIPVGILSWRVRNTGDKPLQVSLAGSMCKFTLAEKAGLMEGDYTAKTRAVDVVSRKSGELDGLLFAGASYPVTDCSMALACLGDKSVSRTFAWLDGGWFDGLQGFWSDFLSDGQLEEHPAYRQKGVKNGWGGVASLCASSRLEPGEETVFRFLISWYFPRRIASWSREIYRARECPDGCGCGGLADAELPTVRNYYAGRFTDAWDAAEYTAAHFAFLEQTSRQFHDAFFGSTLPWYVLDAITAGITVLRSPTCFRLSDGTLMAWEGCFCDGGCCEGNCTHVWNYAQGMAFLFPELERSMRRVDFLTETEPDGRMYFRSYQKFGHAPSEEPPAADGQMGTIVRLYREWKLSPDDSLLRELWEPAKHALDFAFSYWDRDGDFVLDGSRHNTYDIEFQGTDSLTGSLFYAALAAGAEMALAMGEPETAARWKDALQKGAAEMDRRLWNGAYYRQECADPDEYRYQYGEGCLSDQVFGQLLAHVAGLGYLLPKEHVRSAVKAVYDRNFIRDFRTHTNLQRTYALNGESGLVLCSWEEGQRPQIPFPYSDEVWTGVEYQVASHLIYEGYVAEGLELVRAVRERYDGIRRNPWNETECGNHYARCLAGYGLLTALTGMRYDIPRGQLTFRPAVSLPEFRSFFCAGTGWGVYTRTAGSDGSVKEEIKLLYGTIPDTKKGEMDNAGIGSQSD